MAIVYPDSVVGKKYSSQDPYEDQGITPLAPISPAEVDPIGMLDGIYPKSDLEGKSIENLYYGRMETHEYAADDGVIGIRKEVDASGNVSYYNGRGQFHRENGPAREWANGDKEWYYQGLRHREDDPAAEYSNGAKYWYHHGLKHREDGPADEDADGAKEWFQKDKRHREDGPAVEYTNGGVEYWYHGKQMPEFRTQSVKLWNGIFPCIVDFANVVLRLANAPHTQDNTIWAYSENYEPLYQPKLEDLAKGIPAATLHDINEGLPPPETGLINDANNSTY